MQGQPPMLTFHICRGKLLSDLSHRLNEHCEFLLVRKAPSLAGHFRLSLIAIDIPGQ